MLKPLRDHILVKQDELNEVASAAGIILTQKREGFGGQHDQLGRSGTVVAVGPGKVDKHGRLRPLTVRPGDRVMWEELKHPLYTEGVETFHLLQEADITAVLSEEPHHGHA